MHLHLKNNNNINRKTMSKCYNKNCYLVNCKLALPYEVKNYIDFT